MIEPPHRYVHLHLEQVRTRTCHGHECGTASAPPTILNPSPIGPYGPSANLSRPWENGSGTSKSIKVRSGTWKMSPLCSTCGLPHCSPRDRVEPPGRSRMEPAPAWKLARSSLVAPTSLSNNGPICAWTTAANPSATALMLSRIGALCVVGECVRCL